MNRQAPEMLDASGSVGTAEARTEVLARAFSDAAGGYFERLRRYEDAVAAADEEMERMKLYGAGAIVGGILLVALSIYADLGLVPIAAGVIVAIAGGALCYQRYTDAQERREENERNIDENEPDGRVTFVSRIGVPMYLVPYGDRHMIFDGLDTAPETNLDLANIDGDTLVAQQEALRELKSTFDDHFGDETVVDPDYAEAFAPDVREHRQIERPIVEHIDEMSQTARDIDRDVISVGVHANNTKSRSVRTLAEDGELRADRSLKQVETPRSIAECEAAIDEIRGVEEQAVSGDMLDQARRCRDEVDAIATDLEDRQEENIQTVDDHFADYAGAVGVATSKHVCVECLDDEIASVDGELNLVDQILSSEAGSLGTALSDRDLDTGTDEAFTSRIREDIKERIPEMDRELTRAYNTLDDLGVDEGHCPTHGPVDTVEVADSGSLFGEVWRALYYAFREPIMESANDLERDAEDIRQNKEQKMIDLTQYEQIKEEVEREYRSVKSEYDAARQLERNLG